MSDPINLSQLGIDHTTPMVLEMKFEPFSFLKFISLLLVFLFIPFLSLAKLFTPTPTRQSSRRRSFPVDYVRNLTDKPFVPLKTRRHFRISHIGNQPRSRISNNLSGNSSDSETESCDETLQYKLVWGKRRRGEESEFTGQSAMKGGRERERERRRQLALQAIKSELTSPPPSPIINKSRSVTISTIPMPRTSMPFLAWTSPASDLFALPLPTYSNSNSTALFRSTSFNLSKSSHLSRHLNSASPPLVNSLVRQSKRFSGSGPH
ncbi:uncharacterized protein MELLADRAFT_118297 [Melampsora larici-populina 98AG31]|uniref:Uncharacterized protein n=1 Tax=Melampsora larici-populina (strain 98AG31 / pathotype 3-4-7) TaxID=747676 RepID=F4S7A8_MELLP|nr:uncharacterized protein MELLADRAFT_118297 [Melampsora larici-populina 98AG31]EGF99508.1 hypothetical protein MELLADRAFT_118297 [Melampsora larici-populina 98AG31]